MKTVSIKYFNSRQQNRITLVRLLTEYTNWGLKKSKDNMDSMLLDNKPIICEIEDLKVDSFTNELINLKLEFEIK
ncbi:hypothetical protein FHS86_000596 [Roseimarinus sediminis]